MGVGIRDVAGRAGVSLGTVSNALNRPDRVAPAALQRVRAEIEDLGFIRNEAARQLRTGRSRTIALLVLATGNPFFTDFRAPQQGLPPARMAPRPASALFFAHRARGEAPVMTEPGDGTGAAAGGPGHGQLRASHADRARVTDVLKAAFVEGRLTPEELDARIGQASTARTYAELATLTADLPAGQPGGWPRREPARAHARPAAQTGACVIVFAASVLTVLLLVRPMSALALAAALGAAATIVVASILTAALMLESRHQPRSGGPPPRSQPAALPPQSAASGGGPAPDGPAGDFPQVA